MAAADAGDGCVALLLGVHGHCGSWTAFFPLVQQVLLGERSVEEAESTDGSPPKPSQSSEHEWHAYALDFNSEAAALHPRLVETQVRGFYGET